MLFNFIPSLTVSFKIIKTGTLATVQDMGRYGLQHVGVGAAGAMDKVSAMAANYLVNNSEEEAVLELHFPAPEIYVTTPALIAVAGGDFQACFEGHTLKANAAFVIKKPGVLQFKKHGSGARVYIAVQGGFAVAKWNDSYSTMLSASAGGYNGRALQRHDEIGFKQKLDLRITHGNAIVETFSWYSAITTIDARKKITILKGKEWDWLTAKSQHDFFQQSYSISRHSNRMGIRLSGSGLTKRHTDELISTAVTPGTVQLLPNGELIVLMADNQTTGGYPRVAHVTSASLSALAQKNTGESIQFECVDVGTAETQWLKQLADLRLLKSACILKFKSLLDEARH
jgi:antagonist of KipI